MVEQHEATGELNDAIRVEPACGEHATGWKLAPGSVLEAEPVFAGARLVVCTLTLEVAARVDRCEQALS